MESHQSNINYKGYRFVGLINSPSFIANNLTTNDGEFFAYVNNVSEGQPKAVIYSRELIEKGEVSQPQILQWKDQSECFQLQYVKVLDKWYLVIATTKGCQIWNHNATRQMTFLESKKKLADGKTNFFTCAATAFEKGSGKQFIAVGTSAGEIYAVEINGQNFTKELGFQMTDDSAITAMTGDQKSQTLAVGNSNGYIVIFECDNQSEWKPIHSIAPENEIPITSMGTLNRGENLFVVGFVNGMIKIVNPHGLVICEMSAHSRCLNALSCHPTRSVFATCSDDTFLNIFEVTGDKIEKIDVNLILSSHVNDYQLCGLAFGGDSNSSLVAVPYDFKTIAVWNNVV